LVKEAVGVTVKTVDPEHAAVAADPCPNSTATPVLIEIFAAKVVLRKSPPASRIRIEASTVGVRRRRAEASSIGSS
jgi:hypothetical protein